MMVAIGRAMGKGVRAVLTAMDQPLGRNVGNALEVAESVACLHGRGPADLMEVTYVLGAHMLVLGRAEPDLASARRRLEQAVASGAALEKFRAVVAAQGGDARVADDPARLPAARRQAPLLAAGDGTVQEVDAMGVALAALRLGAGRARAEDAVDPAVGVSGLVKIGEPVVRGQPLCIVHANDDDRLSEALATLARAIVIGDVPVAPAPLISGVI